MRPDHWAYAAFELGDFEGVIARFAPGSVIHLTTLRDGELFDRTITLGYGRWPSGLSASNLAASQAADAFPSLKKTDKTVRCRTADAGCSVVAHP